MSLPIVFVICTEPGRLENQSVLLAQSIREFAGAFKNTPIYSIHPRAGQPINDKTQKAFNSLDVQHEQILLNVDYPEYYLANKPLVCAYAEQTIDAEILVFIDSDKCFFAEPQELLLPLDCSVGLRPEYGKGIGSEGAEDGQDTYWRKMYDLFDVHQETFVITSIGSRRIRAYWNSGLVTVRRKAGIFAAWKNNFEKVMQLKITPPQGLYMVEQSLLAITVCAMQEKVHTFSSPYSYPLPLHSRLSTPAQLHSFDDIVSIHYFNMFFFNDWKKQLDNIKKLDKTSHKYLWLCEQLSNQSLPPRSIKYDIRMKWMKVNQKTRAILSGFSG